MSCIQDNGYMTIAIANSDGTLTFVESPASGNMVTLGGVRYKAIGTVTRDGQHVGVYRASAAKSTKHGNCPRCSGTGSYGELGVCYACNGTGRSRDRE